MKAGQVSPREMCRTFNCGVGMVLVVARDDAEIVIRSLLENGVNAEALAVSLRLGPFIEFDIYIG